MCGTCWLLRPQPKLSYIIMSLMHSWKEVHCKGLSGAGAWWRQHTPECGLSEFSVLLAFQRTNKCSVLQRGVDRYFPSLERRWQIPVSNGRVGLLSSVGGWSPWGPEGGSKALAGEEAARKKRRSRAKQCRWVQVERPEASFQERRKDSGTHPSQYTPSLPTLLSHFHFILLFS